MVRLHDIPRLALVLTFASACDPSLLEGEKPSTAKVDAPDAAVADTPKEPEAGEPSEPPPTGACLAACARAQALSSTDQETCRLVCTPQAEQAAPSPALTAIARYEVCHDHCTARSDIDRSTCSLDCARTSLQTIEDLSDEARACMSPCLDALGTCEKTCTQRRAPRATDHETCRLQCEAVARSCTDRCDRSPS